MAYRALLCWRQTEGAPDPADGHAAQAGGFGQPARGPVRLPARRAFQGLNDDLLYLHIAHFARCSWARFIVQAFHPSLQKSPSPLTHHADRCAQFAGYALDPKAYRGSRLEL